MNTQEIKMKTFEYILYEMILWYAQLHKINTAKFFNEQKVFPLKQIQHYPFFIFVAANATDREDLLSLFDSFVFEDCGFIEKDIRDNISLLTYFDVDDLQTYIKPNWIRLDYLGRNCYFDGLITVPLIKRSIEQLKESNIRFVDHSFQVLSLHNKRHDLWQFVCLRKKIEKGYSLPLKDFLTAKSIYSPDPKLIQFIGNSVFFTEFFGKKIPGLLGL